MPHVGRKQHQPPGPRLNDAFGAGAWNRIARLAELDPAGHQRLVVHFLRHRYVIRRTDPSLRVDMVDVEPFAPQLHGPRAADLAAP